MIERLDEVLLKSGERVACEVITGPDLDWAERVEGLLAHKGDPWNWQNSQCLRTETGIEVFFYVLHREGRPFANVMTAERSGVGIFGHVWTRPEDRRQGAMSSLLGVQMAHFRSRGGRALFLGTGYDSPAYHLYLDQGFRSVEEGSGYMAFYASSREDFEAGYFARGDARIEATGWPHWPGSAALFVGDFPGTVRCVPLRLLGRRLTEGPLLPLIRDQEKRRQEGQPGRSLSIRLSGSSAVVGLSCWDEDPTWPSSAVVDVYCHPGFWDRGKELLLSLALPDRERIVAYSDPGCEQKEDLLQVCGFRPIGIFGDWVAVNRTRTVFSEVRIWVRR